MRAKGQAGADPLAGPGRGMGRECFLSCPMLTRPRRQHLKTRRPAGDKQSSISQGQVKGHTVMISGRIDVHTHLVPPFWAEELKSHGGDPSGWASPKWSPEQAISFMDAEGIQAALLSLTAPGIEGWVEQERPGIARRINDYGAALVEQTPGGSAAWRRCRSRTSGPP